MSRHLRIGVVRAGRLVDDRSVLDRETVSIGSGSKSTFVVPRSSLPRQHEFARFEGGKVQLHVLEGMTGELAADGQQPKPVSALIAGAPRDAEGACKLELPETVRGWLAVGDTTFLLEAGAKAAPAPVPALPSTVQAGLLESIDKVFAGILIVLLAIEGLGILAIHALPPIENPDMVGSQEDLDRFAEIIMPDKPKEEPKAADEGEKKEEVAADDAKPKEEAKKEEETAKKDDAPEEARDSAAEAARKEALRNEVRKTGLLNVIGSVGGAGGALANVFAAGAGFSDDIGKALDGAGGVKLATGNDTVGQRKEGSGVGTVGIGDLGASVGQGGAGAKAATQLTEKARTVAPQIALDDSDIEVESSSIDKDSLGRYIKMRIKSVQQCYEQQLKLNPSLKGKIVVRFVVTTAGRVGEVSVEQNTMGNQDVAACIQSRIKTWSFPFKPEEDSPVSFPFVFSPGQ